MFLLLGARSYLPSDNPFVLSMIIIYAYCAFPSITGSCAFRARSAKGGNLKSFPLLPARARFAHDPLKAGMISSYYPARMHFAHDPLKARYDASFSIHVRVLHIP